MEVIDQLHAPPALTLGKTPITHWIGGCVGPTASLNAVEKRMESAVSSQYHVAILTAENKGSKV
jgi:hypothetical protein